MKAPLELYLKIALNLLCILMLSSGGSLSPRSDVFIVRLWISRVQDLKDVLGKDVYSYKFSIGNIKAAVGAGSLGSAVRLPAQS